MNVFLRSILSVLRFVCSVLMDGWLLAADAMLPHKGHSAGFGSILKLGNRFEKAYKISRTVRMSEKKAREGVLLVANVGAGKTSGIILPSLFELRNCSIIINDGGDIYPTCSGYLSQFFDIKVLNPSDASASCGFNPLDHVMKQGDEDKISHILTKSRNGNSTNEDFWQNKAAETISLLIRLTMYEKQEIRTMNTVLECLKMLSVDPEAVDLKIIRANDKRLLLDYKVLMSNSDKVLSSILSTALAALNIFQNTDVAKVVSHSSIRFDELREKPTIIFLRANPAEQDFYAKFTEIFFQQFFSHVMNAGIPGKNALPIYTIIDEASSLYIPVLPIFLANCRKFLLSCLVCIQTHGQLEKLYGKDSKNIIQNLVTKIYLSGQASTETLQELELLAGKRRVKQKNGSEHFENLITADAIRCLPSTKSLIISSNIPVILGRIKPFFKSSKYRKYAKIPPLPIISDIPESCSEPLFADTHIEQEVAA